MWDILPHIRHELNFQKKNQLSMWFDCFSCFGRFSRFGRFLFFPFSWNKKLTKITSEPFYKGHIPSCKKQVTRDPRKKQANKMGNCYSSVTVTDEIILDTWSRFTSERNGYVPFCFNGCNKVLQIHFHTMVLQDVAYWVGTRFALGDLMGKGEAEQE